MAAEQKQVPAQKKLTLVGMALRFFTADDALSKAVEANNPEEVKKLIVNKRIDVDYPYADLTALFESVIARKYTMNVLLLELGANPNAEYDFSRFGLGTVKKSTVVQHAIQIADEGDVKILVFYGGNPQIKRDIKPEIVALVGKIREKYLQRKQLETDLSSNNLTARERADKLLKLAEVWQDLSEGETQSVYREHYNAKAAYYQEEAGKHIAGPPI